MAEPGLLAAPFAVWCHGEEVWGRLRPGVAWSLRRADAVFAPSRFTARRVEVTAGLPAGRARVIPHCLPPEVFVVTSDSRTDRQKVLAVARLAPQHAYKGIDSLIHAWPRVLAEAPNAELVIVGDGPDRPRLELNCADRGGATNDVRGGAPGRGAGGPVRGCSDLRAALENPPDPDPEREGFGLVYIEAAAASIPGVLPGSAGSALPDIGVRRAEPRDAERIAQLLHDFNSEFDEPTPGPHVLAGRRIRVIDEQGVLLRKLVLDPSRDYQPHGRA